MSAANHNSNKALSSAAAAAALRARPHTPTNVAEVQTKRTARRSASISSSGSAAVAAGRPAGNGQLERRGSSSSMTERTFRSPSPHRTSLPTSREQQPPVPQIPASHRKSTSSRTLGVGMQNFRTASQKMKSEPPSWYAQPAGDTSNVRTSDAPMRAINSPPPTLTNITTSQPSRPDSRNSVNFSYPTNFRPQSPSASPTSPPLSHSNVPSPQPPASAPKSIRGPSSSRGQASQQLIYDPNSRRMVPRTHIEAAIEYEVNQAAEKQPRRKRDSGVQRERSQLAKGTVARTKGTTVNDTNYREPSKQQLVTEALPTTENMPLLEEHAVKTFIKPDALEHSHQVQLSEPRELMARSPSPASDDEISNREAHPKLSNIAQVKPPITCGEPEENKETSKLGDVAQLPQTVLGALDAIPTRQALFDGPRPSQPVLKRYDHESTDQDGDQDSTRDHPESPAVVLNKQKAIVVENRPVVELAATESGSGKRSSSNSPARQARFAPSPAENLAVRHIPLPRSASPIKSALKHTSSVTREASPSDNASELSGSGAVSPDQREERAVPRKKSVRVSFDDQNTVVVGESATTAETDSPIIPSSQAVKRPWFSNIGRGKKKEYALEDDEIMKPRPALPSFGSIREKKLREPEERPLVRPLESTHSSAMPSSPELRPQSSSSLNDSETTEEPYVGQSSDHAIGTLLVQDQTSRNAANISRFREPLPPVVTSVEGSGYNSDSLQSSDSEHEHPGSPAEASATSTIPSTQTTQLTQPDTDGSSSSGSATMEDLRTKQAETSEVIDTKEEELPQISVIQPSPMAEEHATRHDTLPSTQYFDVPGGFPEYESDTSRDDLSQSARVSGSGHSSSAKATIFEPTATVQSAEIECLPQTTLTTTEPVTMPINVSADESEESVYSDAYEDIPDVDTGGFMSLDAIVESPIVEKSKSRIAEGSPERAATNQAMCHISEEPPALQFQPAFQDANGWEQAKAFWRSLTAEKRRQLELEAAEDAGAEGDREEVSLPIRRNSSKRKSSEQKPLVTELPQVLTKSPKPIQEQDSNKEHTRPPGSKTDHESLSSSPKQSRMRTSLRNEKPAKAAKAHPQTGMRKTMRSNGGAQSVVQPPTRQLMSTEASAPTSSIADRGQKPRPQSAVLLGSGSPLATQAKPTLQRRGSDASDSSFKRSRPAPGGGFAFRKTMRQTSPAQSPLESTKASGRFSLRSLSPAGSSLRRNSYTNSAAAPPAGMTKRTLRSNSESSQEVRRSSMQFPSFGRSSKAPKDLKKPSRFEDSSDEDEEPSLGFRSRFNDSSDEEGDRPSSSREASSLTKGTLRGSVTAPNLSRPAPVPELEEDSPELPDSEDDHMPSPLRSPQSRMRNGDTVGRPEMGRAISGAIGTSTLGGSRSGRGGLTPSFTTPVLLPTEKRGSLMSILRRNKRADQAGKIQRPELTESAARRDTRLERDAGQLKDLRSELPSSPKLQKRHSANRNDTGLLQRPSSAGNLFSRSATAGTIERPNLVDRRSFSHGLAQPNENGEHETATAESVGLPRKKKFGALRRMFKLDE
ncbi:hypothetical protein F5Y19DRAFT_332659 [Xylariaceae sp. FL1651]|nr:hypothetical protein F5Y19DRAFT_332659 [Xylariaceae sp. FL1651]